MTAEAALLSLLPACALAALLLSVGRVAYVFAVPYVDVENSEPVRRGPGSRSRLLLLAFAATVVGGLLVYGSFAVFTWKAMPVILRLAAYFALVLVAGWTVTLIAAAISVQNQMADEHEIKVGRGHASRGRLWRSNLLEIAMLFGFAAGAAWVCGWRLPDPGSLGGLRPEALETRVNLLRFVAAWTFLGGALAMVLRILQSRPGGGAGKTMLGSLALTTVVHVFKWIYSGAVPKEYAIETFLRGRDVEKFVTKLAQAEAMATIGLSLVVLLVAAPLLDLILRAVAPSLKPWVGRLLGFIAAFAVTATAFATLDPLPGTMGRSFLAAATVGIGFAIATPTVVSAVVQHPLYARDGVRWTAIGATAGLAILVLSVVSSFEAATALLAAAAVFAAGAMARAPETPEPSWERAF
jgi:hypothetical protein